MSESSEYGDIVARLATLEQQVRELREGSGEARRAADLFALVDRDIADLTVKVGAQQGLMQALRETQIEQGRTLTEHGRVLGVLVTGVDTQGRILEALLTESQRQGEILDRLDPGTPGDAQ